MRQPDHKQSKPDVLGKLSQMGQEKEHQFIQLNLCKLVLSPSPWKASQHDVFPLSEWLVWNSECIPQKKAVILEFLTLFLKAVTYLYLQLASDLRKS